MSNGAPARPGQLSRGGKRRSRTTSMDKTDKNPSLPKDGAHKLAKQINQAVLNNNNDFMKTPDAGVAG